jgi:multiple sugar transport system substrate-binding protein
MLEVKKSFCILASALTLSLIAVSPSISAKKVTLTYWDKWTGFEETVIRGIITRFNKSHNNIEVKYVLQPGTPYEKFLAACAAGNPPDIMGGWNHRLAPYVFANVAQPLDSYLKAMGLSKSQFIPSYWDMMTYKGKVYGIPLTPACFATYWNKTLFAAAGLNPAAGPKTLEDILAMNNKLLKKDGNGRITQIGYSPSMPNWWPYWWPVAYGAELVNEDKGIIDMSQPGYVKAMEWVRNVSAQLGGLKSASLTGEFLKSKVAITITGSWHPSYVVKQAPQLQYGIGDMPYGQGGSEWSWLEADVVFLPRAGKHNKEAAEFLRYMMNPEVQREFQLARETFSAIKSVNTPDFVKANKNPGIEDFVKIANGREGNYAPKIPIWADIDTAVYGTMVTDVWSNKKSPSQAVKDAQSAVDVIVKRKWKRK